MDPNLIMAIDIVDVLRVVGSRSDKELRSILFHAAQHIEVLRSLLDRPPEAPAQALALPEKSYHPDDYKDAA